MDKVKCNNCDWVGYELQLNIVFSDGENIEVCPICKKGDCLMDIENDFKKPIVESTRTDGNKFITLNKAIDILNDAIGIIIDDDVMSYSYPDRNNDCFLETSINRNSIRFKKKDNVDIMVKDASMYLIDENGKEHQITILMTKNIEEKYL